MKWIGPGTEEVLAELGDEGVTDVLVIPLSFVSDHIETLYEVDMLFADAARAAGITGYYRPPGAELRTRCSSRRWRDLVRSPGWRHVKPGEPVRKPERGLRPVEAA